MDKRIVESGLKIRLKNLDTCPWLPDSGSASEIDWEHNRCKRGCDGKDVYCKYHPLYVEGSFEAQSKDSIDYHI